MTLLQLKQYIDSFEHADYPQTSRVHKLNGLNGYVKREDELGFGISGSKIRKFRTLIPFLLKNGIEEAAILGGPFSNNVLSIVQLLIENRIQPKLFLKGKPNAEPIGNHFLLNLFVSESQKIWFAESESAGKAASDYVLESSKTRFLLQEGSSVPQAFPGALTLATDILRNEEDLGIRFKNILIDSGTGFTAISLILAFAFLQKETLVHVLALGDSKEAFVDALFYWKDRFETSIGQTIPMPKNYRVYEPTTAKSFGSINAAILGEIRKVAMEEGFLVDPIYSGKLFYEARKILSSLEGESLLVHTGGALTLAGFQNKF